MKGFTLIEVLVAVSLLAVISVLVWQTTGTTIASKERFDRQDEAFQSATLALTRIARDLESAYVYSTPDFLGRSPSGEQRTKTVFTGTDEGESDRIVFDTLTHIRYLKDVKQSDQAEVSYFLTPEEEGGFVLKKREQSPPDSDPTDGGEEATLLEGVVGLNFRYFDIQKGEFVDGWDSAGIDQPNRLPRAVEIILTIKNPRGNEEEEGEPLRFMTTAFLGMAPGPNDF